IGVLPKNLPFVSALRPFGEGRDRPAVTEEIAIAKTRADDRARIRAVTERQTDFLALGFLRRNVETQRVPANRRRFDLEDAKQSRFHQLAKLLVDQLRAVSLAAEFAEAPRDVTRPEMLEAFHRHTVEMIERPGRYRNDHWHLAIRGRFRVAGSVDFDFVVTARAIIGLQTPRNIGDAPVGVG